VRSALTDDPETRNRRGEINSDFWGASAARRRQLLVDQNGMPVSDAATFSNLNPGTSDADALGGQDNMVVWGTNISLTDTKHAFDGFLLNYQRKYRMIKDGELDSTDSLPRDHAGNTKEYQDMMKLMLELGVSSLNLDMRNLKAYPPTTKLWHQMQHYPEEVVPVMDSCIKDAIIELAQEKVNEERQAVIQQHQQRTAGRSRQRDSSSLPPVPSSDAPDGGSAQDAQLKEILANLGKLVEEVMEKEYKVRPFGLDSTINLRELNPGGM
jgi:DNA replication licensing factor MCM4